jgi:hypothetical protein
MKQIMVAIITRFFFLKLGRDEEIAPRGIQGVVDLRVVHYYLRNFYFKTLHRLVTVWFLLQIFRLIITSYKYEWQSK